jgi:hypothetical protein
LPPSKVPASFGPSSADRQVASRCSKVSGTGWHHRR